MSLVAPMLAELEQESKTTRKLLERLPPEKLAWKPHARSMSLGDLAFHVATIPHYFAHVVSREEWDFRTDRTGLEKADTVPGIVAALESSLRFARETLGALEDARLAQPVALKVGGKPGLQLPRIAVLRTIMLNHCWHHRGQLSVYLRLLDVPLPSIYGPSADENPWA